MGSATRQARAVSRAALAALDTVELTTVEELFAAGRAIGESSQLRAMLADFAAAESEKKAIVAAVFGDRLGSPALGIVNAAVGCRWSSQDDLLAGIEELGLRAAAESAPGGVDVDGELFAFAEAVVSDNDLELALGSGGDAAAKAGVVDALLAGKASPQTLAIVRQLVQQPRGRRIRKALQQAAAVVADQAGQAIATVSTAMPLNDTQLERLRAGLSDSYGRRLRLNHIIDPSVIGGVRIQVGDDILDDSIASKLRYLQLQLAG